MKELGKALLVVLSLGAWFVIGVWVAGHWLAVAP